MQMRWDIINALIEKNNYKSYLEIGYYKGWSFDQIKIPNKTAVDPNPSKTPEQEVLVYGGSEMGENGSVIKMTSDDWFAGADKWRGYEGAVTDFDIIFIDGLHEAEQVYRDIQNALKYLAPGGTIVLHDVNPPKYEHTTTGIDGCWTGDAYKAFIEFRFEHPSVPSCCVDTDWGVGIIRPFDHQDLESTHTSLLGNYPAIERKKEKPAVIDWDFFSTYRKRAINLITIEEFKERYL